MKIAIFKRALFLFALLLGDVSSLQADLLPGAPVLTSATVSGTSVVLTWTQDNAEPEGGYDTIIDGQDTNWRYRTSQLTITIPDIDTSVPHCFAIEARYPKTSQFLISNGLCTEVLVSDNSPPLISGTPPAAVAESELYSFTPSASDPDGDNLTFSISGKPSWASFDTSTGTLTGIPATADIGVYNSIIISVSDGSTSVSLAPFSITVVSASEATGSANLNWAIPTTRTDGSELPLSEIAGYQIWLGTSSDNLQMQVDLNDSSATSYTISNLTAGTYYFAVTVYDIYDNPSEFSNLATKTIN
jgi:hypothetical protein